MDRSVLKDTLDNLRKVWGEMAASVRDAERAPAVESDLSDEDATLVRKMMHACLEARGGEVAARLRAANLGQIYLTLDPEGRRRFLEILAVDFAVDRDAIQEVAHALHQAADLNDYLAAEERMRTGLISPRLLLLRQFNALPQGVKFLIDMRADLLRHVGSDPRMKSLDEEFKRLLADWFDVGFLELRHIGWDSPASLLEKLIDYEAVHEIHSWDDLRNRLESDRRCYAFFHPVMEEEPLIFVEVALVSGMAGNIQELLDPAASVADPADADTAIFYSISNTQKGLQGISFGNFLIKRVVNDLRHELPNIKNFSTLSPIPLFHKWLEERLAGEAKGDLEAELLEAVATVADKLEVPHRLKSILAKEDWFHDEEASSLLHEPLERLCALYFHQERGDGTPIDPVERFHLGNGARIERLNWLADTSPKGMRQSCGLMVNYRYKLGEIEKNHEGFATERLIASSGRIRSLLKNGGKEGRKGRFTRIFPAK